MRVGRAALWAATVAMVAACSTRQPTSRVMAAADAGASEAARDIVAPASVRTPDVPEESGPPAEAVIPPAACEAACANVVALIRAEVGALDDDGRAIVAGTEGARSGGCVDGCLRNGDRDSVACATRARSLVELGGCAGPPRGEP